MSCDVGEVTGRLENEPAHSPTFPSLPLRHRLRVFENKVLRKIFGVKRDDITGHVVRMEKFRNACRVLVRKPESKRPLGRPRRRWEDNIKMDLREVGCDPRNWIALADLCKVGNEPPGSLKAN